PSITLSPTASAESMSERCEMLLSPGTVTVPVRGPLWEKETGVVIARLLTAPFPYGKARVDCRGFSGRSDRRHRVAYDLLLLRPY
ncbi:MAG: hypothetical protein RLZZ366_1397, partial [Pseudomonadota bacterium]